MSKYTKTLKRLKRLAPKVPDYTCPDIDFIVDKIENNDKGFTRFRKKILVKKLERLRLQNEQLRDSGEYWYKKFRDYLVDLLDWLPPASDSKNLASYIGSVLVDFTIWLTAELGLLTL